MRNRVRLFAALLALFAFTASFAEQVWASACEPEMAGAAASMHMPAEAAVPDHSSHSAPRDRGPERPDCPLSVMPAGSCAVVAILPADPGVEFGFVAIAASSFPVPDVTGRMVASPLFRPPQQ